jgi:hypothetical protein
MRSWRIDNNTSKPLRTAVIKKYLTISMTTKTTSLAAKGEQNYDTLIQEAKETTFGPTNTPSRETMLASKLPKCDRLMHELGQWEDVTILHCPSDNTQPTSNHIKNWHRNLIKARNILRKITTSTCKNGAMPRPTTSELANMVPLPA